MMRVHAGIFWHFEIACNTSNSAYTAMQVNDNKLLQSHRYCSAGYISVLGFISSIKLFWVVGLIGYVDRYFVVPESYYSPTDTVLRGISVSSVRIVDLFQLFYNACFH